jgi:membrane protease YdiL (CAAX protease family)
MLTDKHWRVEVVIQIIGLQLGCLCFGGLLVGLLDKLGVAGFHLPDVPGAVVVGTLCFQGATWGLIGLFLWQHGTGWREAFGLRDPRRGRALGLALGLVVVALPLLLGLQQASVWVLTWLGRHPEQQTAVELLETTQAVWFRVYLGGFAVVLAPVAEEFLFRGMLFPFLKQLGFPGLAWFGVSALFALIHANAASFLPLFVLALALTWLYEHTDNLLAPVAAHAGFNAVNLVLVFLVPDAPVT